MKRITFRAEEDLVDRAREIARSQNGTLSTAFQEWLVEFTESARSIREYNPLATE
jgi:hypothetical protein